VDAALILGSRPGRALGDVFAEAQAVYAETGFGDEWTLHHQGGPTGYATRDYLVRPGMETPILAHQALAWNPSITGTKSEATILVGDERAEVLTETAEWPMISVQAPGGTCERPDILQA
jgi:antitoxin VapB